MADDHDSSDGQRGVANGTHIINTAVLTGEGLLPLEASAAFLVDTFDLASSVKLVNTAAAIAGDVLTYTIQLTNTSLHKDSAFTLTDVIPANATYVPGSLTVTLGSASYTGGIITWTGGLSGTAMAAAITSMAIRWAAEAYPVWLTIGSRSALPVRPSV